jgi:hypothetical protein
MGSEKPHLRGLAPSTGVEKKPKKSRFLRLTWGEPHTYNPRPRCFAALVAMWCSVCKFDVKIVRTALFDIVI